MSVNNFTNHALLKHWKHRIQTCPSERKGYVQKEKNAQGSNLPFKKSHFCFRVRNSVAARLSATNYQLAKWCKTAADGKIL